MKPEAVEFVSELPARTNGRPSRYARVVESLKLRPGEWARLNGNGHHVATAFRLYVKMSGATGVEVVVRRKSCFARWVAP